MRKPRKKISQREARRLQKAVCLLPLPAVTPSPRWEIAAFTLTNEQERETRMATRFGLSLRVESFGGILRLFAYKGATDGR